MGNNNRNELGLPGDNRLSNEEFANIKNIRNRIERRASNVTRRHSNTLRRKKAWYSRKNLNNNNIKQLQNTINIAKRGERAMLSNSQLRRYIKYKIQEIDKIREELSKEWYYWDRIYNRQEWGKNAEKLHKEAESEKKTINRKLIQLSREKTELESELNNNTI